MSLAAVVARYEVARRIVKPNTANVVVLDIERVQGRFRVENYRGHMTLEGKFWDLSDTKNIIGRRLRPDEVISWPRTICVAWRRYGRKRVKFAAEWDDGGREQMLRDVWAVYDEADVIVGHNVAAFDTKKLKADWAMMGLKAPRPWKSVDTLTIARREFGFESNTLASLCQRMNVPGKVDKYDPICAEAAVTGDLEAQKRLRIYNQGDIEASEALYDAFRGWIANHPFMGLHGEEKVCNQCAGHELTLLPTKYRAVVLDYPLYRCDDCGAHLKGQWVARAAKFAGVR